MTNSLSSLNPSFWAREAEESLYVENMAMAVANTRLVNLAAGDGSTVYRTILSYPASQTYTPGSDVTPTALTASSESLSISTFLTAFVSIDDTEKKQSIVDIGKKVAKDMMALHNNSIEQAVLGQISNASWNIDEGNVGGTSGSNITLTTDNVPNVFTAADTKLDATDAPKNGRVAVVGGHFLQQLKLQQAARATSFGDQVNANGFVGRMFGYDIVYSNNLPYSATLTIATNPTDLDTVTIAGVTFTFTKTVATAGDVLLDSSSAHTSRAALAAAINDSGTAGTTYYALSAENRFLLRDKRRVSATNSNSANTIALTGYGDIVVSETLTAAADVWSAQLQKSLFAVRGCVDQVVQIPPHIEVNRDPDQFADIVKSLLGYGVKTFADGARKMVYAKIDASSSDWS